MNVVVTTARLALRDWSGDDAPAALAIYGSADVARWLTPTMDRVTDLEAMRSVLHAWQQEQPDLLPPQGRWAIQRTADGAVVGGVAIRLLPLFGKARLRGSPPERLSGAPTCQLPERRTAAFTLSSSVPLPPG